ncbi:hypothetical protein [Marinococcus halotolerans]|uniref:hypothetical protein n=1 Tax=Marinococcus halotolerans TaxID=301092 RepID=UPI0012EC74DA|nr:hypothetical protein [Marinococcus halotolerans]
MNQRPLDGVLMASLQRKCYSHGSGVLSEEGIEWEAEKSPLSAMQREGTRR